MQRKSYRHGPYLRPKVSCISQLQCQKQKQKQKSKHLPSKISKTVCILCDRRVEEQQQRFKGDIYKMLSSPKQSNTRSRAMPHRFPSQLQKLEPQRICARHTNSYTRYALILFGHLLHQILLLLILTIFFLLVQSHPASLISRQSTEQLHDISIAPWK